MPTEYDAVLFDLFGTLVDDRGRAIAGAAEILQSMPTGKWAIVTSCGARLAAQLLAYASLPQPHVIITSDDVSRQKPAPDGYLAAARRLLVEPARCLVFEDSTSGVCAAQAAGMDVVRVGPAKPIASILLCVQKNGTIAMR